MTRFSLRFASLFLAVSLLAGVPSAYALRISQSPRIRAGMEEELRELDTRVQAIYEFKRGRENKKWAAYIASKGVPWLLQGGSVPRKSTSDPKPKPVRSSGGRLTFSSGEWLRFISFWKTAIDLRDTGMQLFPMKAGRLVMFYRESRSGILLDLFAQTEDRPDSYSPHRYVGRLDLQFDPKTGMVLAAGAGNFATDFSPQATRYRHANGISAITEDSGMRVRRTGRHESWALYIDPVAVQALGLREEVMADALLYAAVNVIEMREIQQVGLLPHYDNEFLNRLAYLDPRGAVTRWQTFHLPVKELKRVLWDRLSSASSSDSMLPEPFPLEQWFRELPHLDSDLAELGIAEFTFPGGTAQVLFRPGEKGREYDLRLDLVIVPSKTGVPIPLARFDLLVRAGNTGVAVARGRSPWKSFPIFAEKFLRTHEIVSTNDPGSPFNANRTAPWGLRSLHVDERAARTLGIPVDHVEAAVAALAFKSLKEEDIHYVGLQEASQDPFLESLFKAVLRDPGFSGYKAAAEDLTRAILQRMFPEPRVAMHRWPTLLNQGVEKLILDGVLVFPLEDAEAALFHREGIPGTGQLQLDLFMRFEGQPYLHMGRLDLSGGQASNLMAAANAIPVFGNFKKPALEYLKTDAFVWETERDPFIVSRASPWNDRALSTSTEVQRFGLSSAQVSHALIYAATQALQANDPRRIWLFTDKRVEHDFLKQLIYGQSASLRLANGTMGLLNEVAVASGVYLVGKEGSGLEEHEEAGLRVREALDRLGLRDQVPQPVVTGRSVSSRFPGLYVLSQLLPLRAFSIDPGGDDSAFLAELLTNQDPPVDQVRYYGTGDEYRHFAEQAVRYNVSAGSGPAMLNHGFALSLQSLLVSMTRLSPAQMKARGVDVEQLAKDLELLVGA